MKKSSKSASKKTSATPVTPTKVKVDKRGAARKVHTHGSRRADAPRDASGKK